MKQSPTSRTLAWLRESGYQAQVVEKWLPQARVRVDLFGCIDIVAVAGPLTVGVQATSANGISDRLKKIRELDGARAWLTGDTRQLWVVGWKLYMKAEAGKRWRPIVKEMRLEDLEEGGRCVQPL